MENALASWDNTMVRWNWKTNTWKCECGAENNPPLANFCSQCGSLADKVPLVAAPIAPAESCPPKEHMVPLRNPDLLLNIFGVALVVEKTTGNMVVFSDPLHESTSFDLFDLSRVIKGIVQVGFDQWWVYVLNSQGTLSVFPVSALSNEYMAKNTNWRLCAEDVHKFWLFKNCLFVIDEDGLKIGDTPSVHNFWAEKEKIAYKFQDIDTPFDVETLVPLQGEDFMVVLVGKNQMALLTDEGVSEPYEGFLDGGKSHWIVSNRVGLLRLAVRQGNGDVRMISFSQDNLEPIHDTLDLQATALHAIDIDGQDWFVVITSDSINLVDPLNGSVDREYPVFMRQTDMCSSFGNLVAGFQDNEDPGGLPLVALFHFDRKNGISRPRSWLLKTGLTPVTTPAGFGHSVYVLMREENQTKLHCYPLDGDREA